MKKNNGFTLAEMLIVVAIIGVLVSIITISLSNYLEKSREAVDMANIRQAYSLLQAAIIDETIVENKTFTNGANAKDALNKVLVGTKDGKKYYVTAVKLTQKIAEWQSIPRRPGLMIGNMEFWCSTNPSSKNTFYFCVDMEGNVSKAFWDMVNIK